MSEFTQPEPSRGEKITPYRDGGDFVRSGFDGQILVDGSEQRGFSALLVDVHGEHPPKRMIDTTRTYLVLEGEGSFTLDGSRKTIQKGDFIIIPPGGEYQYEGEMQLFELNVSPDNSFKDEKLA